MSHRYGEKLLPRSQRSPKPSSPNTSGALPEDQAPEIPTTHAENITAIGNAAGVIADAENNCIDASDSALQVPSSEEMDSWTLAQLRAHLGEIVVQKQIASGQARNDLEAQRLSLIERVTRLERAEERKRDAARRGEMSFLKSFFNQS